MDSTTVVMIILLVGVLTIVISVVGLINDGRKHRYELRERRRKNLSDNTVKTILSYTAKTKSEAMYYRRRA